MDAVLHEERLQGPRKRIHPVPGRLANLPTGAVVGMAGAAYTMANGRAFRWTVDGYAPPRVLERADGLLTPPSSLMALRVGYRPILHPTLANAAIGTAP